MTAAVTRWGRLFLLVEQPKGGPLEYECEEVYTDELRAWRLTHPEDRPSVVTMHDNGSLSCGCKAFTVGRNRGGCRFVVRGRRGCKHCKSIADWLAEQGTDRGRVPDAAAARVAVAQARAPG